MQQKMSIIQTEKAGARGRASAFEIFRASNYQRILYSKSKKFIASIKHQTARGLMEKLR